NRAGTDAQGPPGAVRRRPVRRLPGHPGEPAWRLDRCQRVTQGWPGGGLLIARRQRGAHPAVAMFARMLRLKERSMLKSLLFALLAAAALATQAQERPDHAVPDAQAIAAERVARNYHQRIAAQIADSGQARDLALAAVLRDLAVADPREPSQ